MRVERIDIDEWADVLPSDGFEVFHTPSALRVLERHVDGDLQLFAGYKGQQPVALMPMLVKERLLSTLAFSPPPGKNVPRLGPVMMPTSPKRRKQEKVNQQFTEAVLDEIEGDTPLNLFRMNCATQYADPRPYRWQNFDIATRFTYVLDLDGQTDEELLGSFSKSLRRDIRDSQSLDITIQQEEPEVARQVFDQTRTRYQEQDRNFLLSWDYVDDLLRSLHASDRARIYTARTASGEFLTGITVLYSNDRAYFWQGGTRTVHDDVSVNSLVHWKIIRDVLNDPPRDSITEYDLMGANTERLCRYKSKFGADLVPYYQIESSGRTMDIAKKTYQALVR